MRSKLNAYVWTIPEVIVVAKSLATARRRVLMHVRETDLNALGWYSEEIEQPPSATIPVNIDNHQTEFVQIGPLRNVRRYFN